MTIRDIRILSNLIDARIELGLPIDSLIIEEFQNNTKHLNYLFASGIDLIHELFKFENKFGNNLSSKIIKFIGNHKIINKYSSQFANKGLFI